MNYGQNQSKGAILGQWAEPPCDAACRERDVYAAQSNLRRETEEANCLAEQVRDRLNAVLRSSSPLITKEACRPVPDYSTPLAAGTQEQVNGLTRANDILRDILDRLEV